MPTCLLVRHGRSTANTAGILAGWSPGVHLDETGREQAAALAERLRDVRPVLIVSSPLTRCLETAQGIVGPDGDVVVDDDLGECRYGGWTGRAIRELEDEPLWRTVQDQPSRARFPQSESYAGESLAEMAARAVRAARSRDEEVAAVHGDHAAWVAVTHGDVIKAVLADAVGAHLDHFQRFRADPASVSVVHYTSRRPFLVAANDHGSDLRAHVVRPPAEDRGDAVVGGGGGQAPPHLG